MRERERASNQPPPYEVRVELAEAGLAMVVEDEDGLDHGGRCRERKNNCEREREREREREK